MTALCWQLLGRLKEKAVLPGVGEELFSARVATAESCLVSVYLSKAWRRDEGVPCFVHVYVGE